MNIESGYDPAEVKNLDELEKHLQGCDNVNWLGEWAAEWGQKLIDKLRELQAATLRGSYDTERGR
jgi:hypothetical protein